MSRRIIVHNHFPRPPARDASKIEQAREISEQYDRRQISRTKAFAALKALGYGVEQIRDLLGDYDLGAEDEFSPEARKAAAEARKRKSGGAKQKPLNLTHAAPSQPWAAYHQKHFGAKSGGKRKRA